MAAAGWYDLPARGEVFTDRETFSDYETSHSYGTTSYADPTARPDATVDEQHLVITLAGAAATRLFHGSDLGATSDYERAHSIVAGGNTRPLDWAEKKAHDITLARSGQIEDIADRLYERGEAWR